MSKSIKHTIRSIVIVVFCGMLATPVAFGSGGGSAGGSGGDSGGSDGPSQLNVTKKTYDLGKKVFYENVVCDSCIYAGLELTPESVRDTWKAIKKDLRRSGEIGSNLKRKERRSVKLFMRKRFNL